MLKTDTGQFLHIDFGHFLNHRKFKLGVARDREPFILSKEMVYFLRNFGDIEIIEGEDDPEIDGTSSTKTGTISLKQASAIGGESYVNQADVFKSYSLKAPKPNKSKNNAERMRDGEKYLSPEQIEDEFEKKAIEAFLELRKNADIFINLLILMIVTDLEELDLDSIKWIQTALFLSVSEEEATVLFRQKIAEAKSAQFRKLDNVFHIISDRRKDKALKEREEKAKKKNKNQNQK